MEKEIPPLNETVNINGSKVYVENGEVKVTFREDIQRTGYMSVEECFEIAHQIIDKEYNNTHNTDEKGD